jgi:hypothetical protein
MNWDSNDLREWKPDTEMSEKLKQAVSRLAEVRQALARAGERVAAAALALHETAKYKLLKDEQQVQHDMEEFAAALTQDVRDIALAIYRASGETKPVPGVVIKMYKLCKYDQELAKQWCATKAPGYLKLDNARFEKAAEVLKDVGAPVQVVPDPRVTIASNLDAEEKP